jgi:hypothetical protein
MSGFPGLLPLRRLRMHAYRFGSSTIRLWFKSESKVPAGRRAFPESLRPAIHRGLSLGSFRQCFGFSFLIKLGQINALYSEIRRPLQSKIAFGTCLAFVLSVEDQTSMT